jgi:STE24 endopeptidase
MIPLSPVVIGYLTLYLAVALVEAALLHLNATYLGGRSGTMPSPFQEVIDREALERINRYQIDNIRFSLVEMGAFKAGFLLVLLSGLLPWGARALSGLNPVWAGLLFFGGLGLAALMVELPLSYYHTFVIEERHGFNTASRRTWFVDSIKSSAVAMVLGGFVLGGVLVLVALARQTWWLWAWAFFFSFQILLTTLYPVLIAPLFNKFTPINDPELSAQIRTIMRKAGFDMLGVYRMDASRRSRHTNAYLAGLGKSKRVVLFDSLLESHKRTEILAILAHELGHAKLGHIRKQLIATSILTLGIFFAASGMLRWDLLYHSFGFSDTVPYVGLFLTAVVWSPIGFFISPLIHWISRRFEQEADAYGVRALSDKVAFSDALRRLAVDNLSNLNPHPAYVWFHHSHPPLAERIRRLEQVGLEVGGHRLYNHLKRL